MTDTIAFVPTALSAITARRLNGSRFLVEVRAEGYLRVRDVEIATTIVLTADERAALQRIFDIAAQRIVATIKEA